MKNILLFFLLNYTTIKCYSQNQHFEKSDTIKIDVSKTFNSSRYYQSFYHGNGAWASSSIEQNLSLKNLSDGIYKIFCDKSHKCLIAMGNITNKQKTGKWVYFYPNKKKYLEINYLNDQKNGNSKLYNHLGELYADLNYKDDKLFGKQTYYGKCLYECRPSSIENYYYTQNKKNGYEIYTEDRYPTESNISFWVDDNYCFGEIKQLQNSDSLICWNSLGIPILYNYTNSSKQYNRFNNIQYKPVYKQEVWKINLSYKSLNEIRIVFYDGTRIKDNVYTINEFLSEHNNFQDYKNLIELHINLYHSDTILNNNIIQNITGLKDLENLQKIVCHNSNVNKIPAFIYECKNLKELHFSSRRNNWSNERIETLQNLETLIIWDECFDTDNLIKQLAQLPNLKVLSLSSSNRWDKLKNLDLLQNLKQLSLYPSVNNDNVFTIKLKIPKDVFKLKNLEYFNNSYGGKYFDRSYKKMLRKMPNCFYTPFGTGCLEKGTKILLSNNNTINIEDIKVGDILIAYNEKINLIDTTTVIKTFIHKENVFDCMEIFLQINDSIIKIGTTSNHPFFSQSNGIINAGSIKINDKLIFIDKSNKIIYPKVQKIQKLKEKYNTVYNIETTKHNYFANGILVHNK